MPCGSSRPVPASATAVPAAARPAAVITAASQRIRATGIPSAPRIATVRPAANITWTMDKSGRYG